MQFKQYPSYKNSGVEWLGDVPEHWQVKPNKYVFKIQKRIAGTLGFNVLSITQKGLKIKDIESNAGQMAQDYSKYQIVNIGDFAMNHMDLLTGWIDIAKVKGVTSPDYRVFEVRNKKVNKEYFLHLFQLGYRNKILFAFGQGAAQMGRWRLQSETFNTLKMPFPSIEEQEKIVAFLDTETTRIDNLIAKQEKLIELLEEQRKSIISHAVTKGLNPNAPMKDSGVEWLGEVPEDWEVKRFGYIFTENKKKNIGLIETNVLSLSYGNIKEKNIDDNKGLLPESFETYQIIEPNDIVFRFTDLQNDKRSLRNAISKYHGIITSAYIGVKTKENADFYNYLFRAYDLQKVFYSMGDGMRQSLKMDELNKMPIVLPKIEAQERIVKFINEENQRINNLVVKQKNLIEKLKEYRSSIISHAVTGKIDVREFGA